MAFSIFEAFSEAIISGVWQIGTCQHGTLLGNQFEKIADIDVIIDEGDNSNINVTPETLGSDMLVYVPPEQLPTTQANKLVSDYMLYDSEEGNYYLVTDTGVGKNQHTGVIEHIELGLTQTEVVDGE